MSEKKKICRSARRFSRSTILYLVLSGRDWWSGSKPCNEFTLDVNCGYLELNPDRWTKARSQGYAHYGKIQPARQKELLIRVAI